MAVTHLEHPPHERRGLNWLKAHTWLPGYDLRTLGIDAIAGITLAAYLLLAGAEMIKSLITELRVIGATLRIVEARSSVRNRVHAQGIDEVLGPIDPLASVADAVDATLADEQRSQTRPDR